MGFWSSIGSGKGLFSSISSVGSAISSAYSSISSSSSQSESEENKSYKKYAAEIRNFKLEDNGVKPTSSIKKQDFQLSQMQDALDDIDSIDDVKKYFQEK